MRQLLNRLVPFIILGIAIVAFVFGIMLLAYLFFFGAMVGIVLYTSMLIRDKFFPGKKPSTLIKRGRTIDSDDYRSS
jgi:nitrate/nitrite transporter NarK